MKYIMFSLLSLLLLTSVTSAYQYRAFVNDETLWGIKDAQVQVFTSAGKYPLYSLTTNAEGYTKYVELEKKLYRVEVSYCHLLRATKYVFVTEDMTQFFKVDHPICMYAKKFD